MESQNISRLQENIIERNLHRFQKTMKVLNDQPKKRHCIQLADKSSALIEGKTISQIKDYRGYFIGGTGRVRNIQNVNSLVLLIEGGKGQFFDETSQQAYCWGYKQDNSPKFSLLLWFRTELEEQLLWVTADGRTHLLENFLRNEDEVSELNDFFEAVCNQHFKAVESMKSKETNQNIVQATSALFEGFRIPEPTEVNRDNGEEYLLW